MLPGPNSMNVSTPAAIISRTMASQRTGEAICWASSAFASPLYTAPVRLEYRGIFGSSTWQSARTWAKPSAAEAMKGEWNPPRTFKGSARPPAALTAAEKGASCSLAQATETWPGQL